MKRLQTDMPRVNKSEEEKKLTAGQLVLYEENGVAQEAIVAYEPHNDRSGRGVFFTLLLTFSRVLNEVDVFFCEVAEYIRDWCPVAAEQAFERFVALNYPRSQNIHPPDSLNNPSDFDPSAFELFQERQAYWQTIRQGANNRTRRAASPEPSTSRAKSSQSKKRPATKSCSPEPSTSRAVSAVSSQSGKKLSGSAPTHKATPKSSQVVAAASKRVSKRPTSPQPSISGVFTTASKRLSKKPTSPQLPSSSGVVTAVAKRVSRRPTTSANHSPQPSSSGVVTAAAKFQRVQRRPITSANHSPLPSSSGVVSSVSKKVSKRPTTSANHPPQPSSSGVVTAAAKRVTRGPPTPTASTSRAALSSQPTKRVLRSSTSQKPSTSKVVSKKVSRRTRSSKLSTSDVMRTAAKSTCETGCQTEWPSPALLPSPPPQRDESQPASPVPPEVWLVIPTKEEAAAAQLQEELEENEAISTSGPAYPRQVAGTSTPEEVDADQPSTSYEARDDATSAMEKPSTSVVLKTEGTVACSRVAVKWEVQEEDNEVHVKMEEPIIEEPQQEEEEVEEVGEEQDQLFANVKEEEPESFPSIDF